MTRAIYRAEMLALAERAGRMSLQCRRQFDLIALVGILGAMGVTAFCYYSRMPWHSSAMIPSLAISFLCHRAGIYWQRHFLRVRQRFLDEMEENLRASQ